MDGDKVCCVLCQQAEETKITGVLSKKDGVTAHQNCLLFSSGIFCRDSPQFDDLFGFSVDDVLSEVKRGNKLICNECKKKGATAGCEVGRCKKSFHYPCAVTAGAKIVEDAEKGNYGLYCVRHSEEQAAQKEPASKSPELPKITAMPRRLRCVCERFGRLTNNIFLLYCHKHAASSRKRHSSGHSTAATPVNSPSCTPSTSKRRRSFDDRLEEKSPKQRSEGWNGMISDTDETDMAMFAPLEFDSDESADSVIEQGSRKDTEESTSSDSGRQLDSLSKEGNEDDKVAESQSLLPPVGNSTESVQRSKTQETQTAQPGMTAGKAEVVKVEGESSPEMNHHTSEPTAPQQISASPPPSPDRSTPAPPETVSASLHPSNPKPSIDSTSFWKGCNMAGCTQALFADFICEMKKISRRIQSDEASQEDYDCALAVMEASGKLSKLVSRQHDELVKKHMELCKAATAMMEVLSALTR